MVDNWRAGSREAGQLVGSVQGRRTTGGQGPGKADNWWAPHLLGALRFSLFSGSESMLTMYAQPVENCKNAKQAPASDMPERVGQKRHFRALHCLWAGKFCTLLTPSLNDICECRHIGVVEIWEWTFERGRSLDCNPSQLA